MPSGSGFCALWRRLPLHGEHPQMEMGRQAIGGKRRCSSERHIIAINSDRGSIVAFGLGDRIVCIAYTRVGWRRIKNRPQDCVAARRVFARAG
jgi:hypothetical protein